MKNRDIFISLKVSCGLVLLALWLPASRAQAQDLETIKDQKLVQVTGGASANTTFYDARGIQSRRDPFYWMLNANLNFNFLGVVQAPFSMTLSQQNKKFAQPQPFNRFGMSPRYKGITAHFGHRSMNFSEYTLGGIMFLGAGVEVQDKKLPVRVSAMYGRLAKAVQRSAQEGLVFANPTFRRSGYGLKLGAGKGKHQLDFIFFHAKDDEHSIEITEEVTVAPEENLVTALHGKHNLADNILFEFEYAYSLLTRDVRAVQTNEQGYSFANNLGGIFKPNQSSEFNNAFTGTLGYNGQAYQLNLKYRQIDPGYRTLGAGFLNGGLKDLTGGISWSMVQQKINVSTNAGIQENNEKQQVVRGIYSVNVNYTASERASVAMNYSNFSTSTRQTQIQRDIFSDTLEYVQVTRNGGLTANYSIGSEGKSLSLVANINLQDISENTAQSSQFMSVSFGCQRQETQQLQYGVSGTLNENLSGEIANRSLGPVANASNAFLDGKIRSALSVALLNSYANDQFQARVYNASITNVFKVAKKHSIALNLYYLINETQRTDQPDFRELRAMVNYNFSF